MPEALLRRAAARDEGDHRLAHAGDVVGRSLLHAAADLARHDRVDKAGKITLRHGGQLYSIGIGRTHARTRVTVLVQDLDIRIIDATTGELTLDPAKRYQGTGRPPGPTRQMTDGRTHHYWVRPSGMF